MKAISKQIHYRRHLLFLDLEGTQFSHEMIAFGAVKATLKSDGSIDRVYKGIKRYVKPKNSIGNFVTKLTGITKEILTEQGITYAQALTDIKNYCGPHFAKTAFVTFGSHDLRIFMQSLIYSPDADETIAKHIAKHHIDMSMLLGQFIRDDKNNPLSLTNYLKVFGRDFIGQSHDPLDDAKNLISIYKDCFVKKDIIYDEYLKVLAKMRHLPEPVQKTLIALLAGETVTGEDFSKFVKDYI